jgi:hypothetical protein
VDTSQQEQKSEKHVYRTLIFFYHYAIQKCDITQEKINKFKNIILIIKTIRTPGILTLSRTSYSEQNIMFWKPDVSIFTCEMRRQLLIWIHYTEPDPNQLMGLPLSSGAN